MIKQHVPITPLLFFFIIIHHVCCQLPPSQLTTMNNLRQLLPEWNNSQQNVTNPCAWTGVSCSPNNSSITNLSLSFFSLNNIINESSWSSLVCQLDTLQTLDVSNNKLTTIPRPLLSLCGNIKVLNFSSNMLTGLLPGFQTSLEVLDLSHNEFAGSIPDNVTEYRNLSVLDLSYNQLTGLIPSGIGQLSNLKHLLLNDNNLTGEIPISIGQLSSLQQLVLSVNNLTGEIPQSMARIASLKRFSANSNGFSGVIPQGITRYVSYLDLSYNMLSGSVPSDLLSQPNLLTVDLSVNRLNGSIPVNVSESLVRLRLGSNRLSGKIPLWLFGNEDPSLAYLELDNNMLTGTIPPELRLCKNLSLLDLSHNSLSGYVPRDLGDLDKLQGVHLDHNNLTGEIPSEIGGLQMLVQLNLSWNSLNGSIPQSLSRLQKLTNLDLQANILSGEIPDSFGDMASLLELQLGNNKLGGVVRSLPVKLQIALNLSSNNFNGPLPDSLRRLIALEVLDLSNNQFSGGIPSFLTQMPSLIQIILSNNQLTGSVPQFHQNVIVSYGGNNLSTTTSKPNVGSNNKNTVSVAIVVASTAAVVALMILVVVAVIVSRKIHRVNDEDEGSRHSPQLEVIKSKLLTLNVIHRTNLDFAKAMECAGQFSSLVLKSRFSAYYKAVMPSGMSYFVKKVDPSAKIFQLGRYDLIEQELETLGRLRNSNVMIPLAYALTVDSVYLLYEFADKGTLFDVLHGRLKNSLDWTNRYSIALGVANGLAFLHGSPSGPILHLDLSSKTIMLKSLSEPQIGDIELSKVIDPSKSTGNLSDVAGSIGYVPPEYAYTMRVTMAGNVYSFGVILLELLTGKTAVSEGSELAKWVSTKSKEKQNVEQILDTTIRWTSQAVKDQMLAVLKVALACVSVSPEARPDMRSLIRMLLNTRN